MATLTRTTVLPLPAATVADLARKPALLRYVLSPVVRFRGLEVSGRLAVGTRGSARLWWFGVLPSWRHHLTVVRLDPYEIRTEEHGGPVRTWNHRLIFEPVDAEHCRYTDEIEIDDGWRAAPTRLFVRLMFRHRHRRWHRLAEILGD
ncbi:SRPBCC family protein [Nocardia sp. NPDC004068]|uniref:SRPBCC family protein n=1 Tax=Nocardia sp. NPDC004068 TaxID=3364303 RepID=UPI00368D2C61